VIPLQSGDLSSRSGTRPGLRIGLLGLAVGAVWLAMSLFTGAQGASASTGDSDAGLLDSLVGQVTDSARDAVQPVAAPAQAATAPVRAAVAPVVAKVRPVPHAAASPRVIAEVVTRASETVAQVLPAAGAVVESAPQAVVEVVAAVPAALDSVEAADIVAPVTRMFDSIVSDTVGQLPLAGDLVGDLIGDAPTGHLLAPVVGGVDGVADAVRSDASTPDHLPSPSETIRELAPASVVGGFTAASALASVPMSPTDPLVVMPDEGSPLGAPTGGELPPVVPAAPAPAGGSGTSAGGSTPSGGTMISDAASAASFHEAAASLALSTVRDELPSSPVFDTDSTPD